MNVLNVDCGRAMAVTQKLDQAIACCEAIINSSTESRNELETCWSGKAGDTFRASMNDQVQEAKRMKQSLQQTKRSLVQAIEKIQRMQEAAKAAAATDALGSGES